MAYFYVYYDYSIGSILACHESYALIAMLCYVIEVNIYNLLSTPFLKMGGKKAKWKKKSSETILRCDENFCSSEI